MEQPVTKSIQQKKMKIKKSSLYFNEDVESLRSLLNKNNTTPNIAEEEEVIKLYSVTAIANNITFNNEKDLNSTEISRNLNKESNAILTTTKNYIKSLKPFKNSIFDKNVVHCLNMIQIMILMIILFL